MFFFESVYSCFAKFAIFSGKASRSEFWSFFLFSFFIILLCAVFGYLLTGNLDETEGLIKSCSLILSVPFLAVSSRRLHDIDKSGWWVLAYFTIVGIPLLVYWYIKIGNTHNNIFSSSFLKNENTMNPKDNVTSPRDDESENNYLINDELVFFGQAYEEVLSGNVEKSLWAMCFANSKDEESTKRLYIKKRASYLNEIFLGDKDVDQIEALIDEDKLENKRKKRKRKFSKNSENEARNIETEERQSTQKNKELFKAPVFSYLVFLLFIFLVIFSDSFFYRWIGLSGAILSGYLIRKMNNAKSLGILEIVFWIIFIFMAYSNNWFNFRERIADFFIHLGVDDELAEIIRDPEQAITSYNLTQFEALSCDNVSRHEGENLINVFGRRTEIIRIYDGEQVSRTSTELICNATSFLSSGGGETDLQVKYSLINGEVLFEIQAL